LILLSQYDGEHASNRTDMLAGCVFNSYFHPFMYFKPAALSDSVDVIYSGLMLRA